MIKHSITITTTILILVAFPCLAIPSDTDESQADFQYASPEQLATLQSPFITESSGIAWGWANNAFWTHNDSGSGSYIFAFDNQGKSLARFRIHNAKSIDWEDFASFQLNNKNYLLIGDIGDNLKNKRSYNLYLVEEPIIPRKKQFRGGTINYTQTITFRYEDGPHNCESLAIDPTTQTIFLLTKEAGFYCTMYTLQLPKTPTLKTLTAKAICQVEVTAATAMDISPDGKRAVIQTYLDAFEFTRNKNQTWAQAFDNIPRQIKMPYRKQGESICFGPDGKTLYLTSENRPTPLWKIPIATNKTTNDQTPSQTPSSATSTTTSSTE